MLFRSPERSAKSAARVLRRALAAEEVEDVDDNELENEMMEALGGGAKGDDEDEEIDFGDGAEDDDESGDESGSDEEDEEDKGDGLEDNGEDWLRLGEVSEGDDEDEETKEEAVEVAAEDADYDAEEKGAFLYFPVWLLLTALPQTPPLDLQPSPTRTTCPKPTRTPTPPSTSKSSVAPPLLSTPPTPPPPKPPPHAPTSPRTRTLRPPPPLSPSPPSPTAPSVASSFSPSLLSTSLSPRRFRPSAFLSPCSARTSWRARGREVERRLPSGSA